ncbi:hypothetical protein [Brevundimonas sp. DC300-4]|uniref:hypothetical protein n=1 Tax=Brevundimonas sp. DC300-4 TaxID=2804594 RepID=UPI003CED4D7A
MWKITLAGVAALICLAGPAWAQVDEIIVTGSRSIEWDRDDIPVVQLPRRADNLIVAVTVVNDTREAAGRRNELIATLRAMVQAAGRDARIDLSIEDDGALVPLTEDMVSTLTLGADPGRADTSVAHLIVKTPIAAADTLDDASGRIETFVEATPKTGRSLVDITGEWELSIIDPGQYRRAILAAISSDATTTAEAFGAGYAVEVSGLSNRVTWTQSGPLDLSLFIPYEMTVKPR